MNAVVSGRAAVAMLIDGEQLYSIHYDGPENRVERAVEDWHLLLGGVNDLEYLDACNEHETRDRLEDAVDRTEALDLVLYLFDRSFSDEIRRTASLELEELLAYPEIVGYLESILYARPLDEAADPEERHRRVHAVVGAEAAKRAQVRRLPDHRSVAVHSPFRLARAAGAVDLDHRVRGRDRLLQRSKKGRIDGGAVVGPRI